MNENILSVAPDFKLYRNRAVFIGAFLGGPLVAGYMAAENFKNLGQPEYAKRAWVIAILTTIVVFGVFPFLPFVDKILGAAVPVAYCAIADTLVLRYQGEKARAHVENGGKMYSTWRAVWVGLIGLAILIGIIYLFTLVTGTDFWS
jgi:hypothetical protein